MSEISNSISLKRIYDIKEIIQVLIAINLQVNEMINFNSICTNL